MELDQSLGHAAPRLLGRYRLFYDCCDKHCNYGRSGDREDFGDCGNDNYNNYDNYDNDKYSDCSDCSDYKDHRPWINGVHAAEKYGKSRTST